MSESERERDAEWFWSSDEPGHPWFEPEENLREPWTPGPVVGPVVKPKVEAAAA